MKVIAYLGDLGVDERMILKWILKKVAEMAWTRFIWLRAGTFGGML